jgi:hypothetical protein
MSDGHPIDEARARELVAGPYGEESKRFASACCVPLLWSPAGNSDLHALRNGTVTLARTATRLLGITAAHVLRGYENDVEENALDVQIANAMLEDLPQRVIAVSDDLDLATIDLDGGLFERLGWEVFPLSVWPPKPPDPDRGIMLCGFPARLIQSPAPGQFAFGPFSALGIASAVGLDQATWRISRDHLVNAPNTMPAGFDLGGISGGPMLAVRENPNGLVVFRLAGIISESQSELEYVVAKRADFIQDDGRIRSIG